MKGSLILAGALAIAFSGYSIGRAQTGNNNSIEFGNTVLRLGMPKDSVKAALASYYQVDDDGFIFNKSSGDAEGQIVFKNGKLVEVLKNWSPSNQQHGYELANNIYGLFKVIEDEGRTNCVLRTESKQTGGSEQKTVFLFCGGKEIEIGTLRLRRSDLTTDSAMLTEILKINN